MEKDPPVLKKDVIKKDFRWTIPVNKVRISPFGTILRLTAGLLLLHLLGWSGAASVAILKRSKG